MPFPRIIPHSDGMGVIDAVGSGVSTTRIGERVWLWNAAWGRACGTAAQYITLPHAQAIPLADSVSGEAGACLGIPACTALHALLTQGGIAGKSILVAGGAGAVGHYAVQFAKLLGARQVITTVSSDAKATLAEAAGADVILNYRNEDVTTRVQAVTAGHGVDRIIEVDIAANACLDVELLKPGGELVIYGSGTPQFALPFFSLASRNPVVRIIMVYTLSALERQQVVDTLSRLLATGEVIHNIAECLPLARIADAHERIEQAHIVGNLVLALE
jgi:NADPH2:quinone reductase